MFFSVPRADTNPIAHRLLDQFGSLSGVLEASHEELMKVKGVGPQTAVLLKLIPSVARCYLTDKYSDGILLDTTARRGAYIMPRFIGQNCELLYLICLDRKNKLLYCGQICEGSLDSVQVDMRKIVEVAMRVSASSVILAHYHTQGFALPSDADYDVTQKVAKILKPLSVKLVDHIIVARDDFISMADSGML